MTLGDGENKDAKRLALDGGKFICSAAPQKRSFEIKTPHAVARVVGTRFSLDVTAPRTLLAVMEGKVQLIRGDKMLEVEAGESATATDKGMEMMPKETRTTAPMRSGRVWAWGQNQYGQLGNGTTKDSPNPVPVPGLDGYEVCRRLKSAEETRHIPVIFLTAMADAEDEAKGLALGAVDYITKPINPELVRARVQNHLELKRHRDHLEQLVRVKTREVQLTQAVMIESLATLAEYRDPETGGHIKRTQNYVKALAVKLKGHPRFRDLLDEQTIELLYLSAPLHDMGKVGVRDHILLKPGRLEDVEFAEMKKHTLFGEEALRITEQKLGQSTFLRHAREIAGSHQEKWDGSGYPRGLTGEAIPVSGRLMALADVYDALISKRVYKPPFPHAKAVQIIQEGRGTHFDPDVVEAFLALEDTFRNIALTFADCDEEREALGGAQPAGTRGAAGQGALQW